MKLGLYFHIPFCVKKCAYCDFYSLAGAENRMDDYRDALLREVRRCGAEAEGYSVDTIYFGGGTPSLFGAERILAVLDEARKCFAVLPNCEIALEANPDTVTLQSLSAFRGAGINRISFGVQSADDDELRTAGRIHTFSRAERAVRDARAAGFENLSLDLIYGLPGQSIESWKRSTERILAQNPEHISCYGLTVEEGTQFGRNRSSYDFPDDDMQAEEYLWLCNRLNEAGFDHYEISNFSLPGKESRHNLKYWRLGEYLGFGPAAYSDFKGVRFGNKRDIEGFIAGRDILAEHEVISSEERVREYLMLGLRLREGISLEEYEKRGGTRRDELEKRLVRLIREGMVREQSGRYFCTDRGFLVNNAVLGWLGL